MPKKPQRSLARAATRTPIRPDGWQNLLKAIAWIAVGSAEPDWDAAFYVGASLWPISAPEALVSDVASIAEGRPAAGLGQVWALHRVAEVAIQAQNRGKSPPPRRFMAASPAGPAAVRAQLDGLEIVAAARAQAARLADPQAGAMYQRLWKASEDLRRALAEGKLAAFGRRPSSHGRGARERIPQAEFAAPVTIGPSGIIPEVEGATFDDLQPVWVDVLIEGAELLRVWPDRSTGSPAANDEAAPTADDDARNAMPPALRADGTVAKEARVHAGARAWMTENVVRLRSWKRGAAIPMCVADVGCTWREATAAWNELPRELKGTRGRSRRGRGAER